jgi:hypothetical protein
MRGYAFRWFCVAAGSLLLGVSLSGQAGMDRTSPSDASHVSSNIPSNVPSNFPSNESAHLGYPQDWSSRHLLMPGMRADDVLAAGEHDPRYVYNMVMRQVAMERSRHRERRHVRDMKIDWAVSLENGYVPQNQFPAKYQFGVSADSCSSDYVVYGLTVTSGTQANLVGINNLYTGATLLCNSGSPWVSFAYNTVTQTGGQIKTSPALSTDGTKVAFVESTSAGSYFHVLLLPSPIPTPPSQDGTVLVPLTPSACTTPTVAGCMTSLTIQTSATDSNSSPWVDYNTDTAYVGADNGLLYKITPVFGGGAPALVNDASNWPVTLSASTQTNRILTAPIVDDRSSKIFVGDGYGYLYAVSLSSPGKTYAARVAVGWVYDGTTDGSGGGGTGVVDPPIVVTDPANSSINQVFAFTGCSIVQGIGGAVSQVPANFTSSTALSASNTVDLGSGSGNGDCTGGNLHSGTFDNAFWLNGSTSGHVIACGFVSGTTSKPLKPSNPKMYFFPFATNLITSTGASNFVVNNTVGEECSPLTEFYNQTTDRLFFGVGGTSTGYLESSTITTSMTTPTCTGAPTSSCVTSPNALGGTSGIVIDNQLSNGGTNIYFSTLAAGSVNGQKCNVTGGTANPSCAVKLTQSGLQ